MKPTLEVAFYKSTQGSEPVRDWLKSFSAADRRIFGEEIKTVQYGWPLGMPLVRKLAPGLWEIRVILPSRTARIIFTVRGETMVLLHGFVKQSQKTPAADLDTANARYKEILNGY